MSTGGKNQRRRVTGDQVSQVLKARPGQVITGRQMAELTGWIETGKTEDSFNESARIAWRAGYMTPGVQHEKRGLKTDDGWECTWLLPAAPTEPAPRPVGPATPVAYIRPEESTSPVEELPEVLDGPAEASPRRGGRPKGYVPWSVEDAVVKVKQVLRSNPNQWMTMVELAEAIGYPAGTKSLGTSLNLGPERPGWSRCIKVGKQGRLKAWMWVPPKTAPRDPELPDGLVPADGRCVPMNADAQARFGLGPEPTSQPDDDDDETARFWGLG